MLLNPLFFLHFSVPSQQVVLAAGRGTLHGRDDPHVRPAPAISPAAATSPPAPGLPPAAAAPGRPRGGTSAELSVPPGRGVRLWAGRRWPVGRQRTRGVRLQLCTVGGGGRPGWLSGGTERWVKTDECDWVWMSAREPLCYVSFKFYAKTKKKYLKSQERARERECEWCPSELKRRDVSMGCTLN